jgi:hypothetical protein
MTEQPLDLDAIGTRIADRRAAFTRWLNSYSPQPGQQALEGVEAVLEEDVPAMAAEIRRLRAELARRVQCNDCGAVGEVFTGIDGLAYLDPSGQIGHQPAARP